MLAMMMTSGQSEPLASGSPEGFILPEISRRCFLRATAAGVLSLGALPTLAERLATLRSEALAIAPRTKMRLGKVYLGNPHSGWPSSTVNLEADRQRLEAELARIGPALTDFEFVDAGLVSKDEELPAAREKLKGVEGILAMHLSMGVVGRIKGLLELNAPLVLFTQPYTGHEWHTVAGMQREGKRIEVVPSSDIQDLVAALRPFRAMHRLQETRVLHVNLGDADAAYAKAIREKFGTEILSLKLPELESAYKAVNEAEAQADAKRWRRDARKIVEPTHEDILRGSRMYVAMKNLMRQYQAAAITMNCLGMGLIQREMGYPCLGFVRLNNMGLAGVCEADLKSTLTQLIFTYMEGVPGFVTDPVFDLATSSIIHAHCVAATQMEGPDHAPAPYLIRSHLEDGQGASLQVQLPVGRKVSMARLIGPDLLLFSTGDATDSPLVDRGCRTKLTMRVNHIEKFLENWSCGLHRVVFYGDHSRDVRRFCRLKSIRLVEEGVEDLKNIPGLEWETRIHA